MLPRDTLSLSQVARAGAVLPVADPRQQAFQRALSAQIGQTMQAEVLSRLDDGSFVVRVNDMAARMPLPQGAQVGQQLPLTLVAVTPRPTFQVETGHGPAFAEAAPAHPDGHAAGVQTGPLAYREGKDAVGVAQQLTRSGALLAQTRALAQLPAGPGGAGASLSPAGKLLGDVIAAAQQAAAQNGAPALQTAATVGRTPLLNAPGADAGQIATALRGGLERSGLFYESHVAEWAQGARTLAELAAEPQARGMPAPTDPHTAQLINQQLHAQEQGRVAWQGQLWPGQDMHWEIERKPDDAPGRRPDEGGADGGADRGADAAGAWQSRLRLRFAALGEVSAQVVLAGGQLHIRLDTHEPDTLTHLQAGRERLAAALDAAGTPLATLAVQVARAAAVDAADADAGGAA